jgi:hypothetical protein
LLPSAPIRPFQHCLPIEAAHEAEGGVGQLVRLDRADAIGGKITDDRLDARAASTRVLNPL